MKEGWEEMTLGDISVKMTDGPFGSNLKSEHYTAERQVRIIQLSNIGEEGWREDNVKYTTFDHLETISRSEVFPNDIVIAKMMPAGRAIICPSHEQKFVLSSDAVKVELKKGFDCHFVNYSINSPYFRAQVYKNVSGTGRVRTSLTKLRACYLRIPPLTEQQEIVDYLDSAFAKVDAMKANAEKALEEGKALFQSALKQILEPKESWEEKRLGDISEIKGGKRLPKGEKLLSEPTNHKYIRVADFNDLGTVDLDDIKYISDSVYEQIKRYIINKEDIYISIAGTIGKSGIIPVELDGANLTENACRLVLSREIDQRYMYYVTISPDFVRQERESTKISAQPKLALTRLAEINVAYPQLKEQRVIVETLDSIKSKVDQLQENYDKIAKECDILKQAILRQVFE